MKAMNKEKLIKFLNQYKDGTPFFEDDMKKIFEEYGDDYYIKFGQWQKARDGKKL